MYPAGASWPEAPFSPEAAPCSAGTGNPQGWGEHTAPRQTWGAHRRGASGPVCTVSLHLSPCLAFVSVPALAAVPAARAAMSLVVHPGPGQRRCPLVLSELKRDARGMAVLRVRGQSQFRGLHDSGKSRVCRHAEALKVPVQGEGESAPGDLPHACGVLPARVESQRRRLSPPSWVCPLQDRPWEERLQACPWLLDDTQFLQTVVQ